MDFLIELLIDMVGEILLLFAPKNKRSKPLAILLRILYALFILGIFTLLLLGIILLTEGRPLGGILIAVSSVLVIAVVAVGIVLYKRSHR